MSHSKIDLPIGNIRDAFQWARQAHEKTPAAHKAAFGDNVKVIDPAIKGKGDICYIINNSRSSSSVIVVFPGSNDWIDWFLNFFRFNKPKNGIHPGFEKSMEMMQDQIAQELKRLQPTAALFTGISRGGAMADYALEKFGPLINGNIDCITFVQPKVFTKDWYNKNSNWPSVKDNTNVRYLRVFMANDPVSDMPPARAGYIFKGKDLQLGTRMSKWKRRLFGWREHKIAVIQSHLDRVQ